MAQGQIWRCQIRNLTSQSVWQLCANVQLQGLGQLTVIVCFEYHQQTIILSRKFQGDQWRYDSVAFILCVPFSLSVPANRVNSMHASDGSTPFGPMEHFPHGNARTFSTS